MNYDRCLSILVARYVRQGKCRECAGIGEHFEHCDCWYYAKRLLDRALREKGRA